MPSPLRIAVDLYDRHLPLFMGAIVPSQGIEIDFLEVGMVPPRRHGTQRHKRMLVDREFDAAEVSLASFLITQDAGQTDLVGLPIFPRRLFSQNHIFVSDASGLRSPRELAGRKVAIWAFQVTMSVLAKGDMQRDHGLDWRKVHWMTQHPEEIERQYGPEVSLSRLEPSFDPLDGLRRGTVDAYINPHPPEAVMMPGNGLRRLFPDLDAETAAYVRRHGYYPVMHLLAVKRDAIERHPELPAELMRMFSEARAMARSWYIDPGFSVLQQARNQLESEIARGPADPWADGLVANRTNLQDFIGFCADQGLLDEARQPEDFFLDIG